MTRGVFNSASVCGLLLFVVVICKVLRLASVQKVPESARIVELASGIAQSSLLMQLQRL